MLADKAIFLDFSNTITTVESENRSISKWLDLLIEKYHLDDSLITDFRRIRLDKLVDRERKFRTFMQINHEVLSELFGISEIFEEDYYRLHEQNLRLRPDFLEFITGARERLQVLMVTDADNLYTKRTLTALGIEKFFDSIVTAEMVGAPKPHQKIFKAALKEAHEPSRVVYIGDSERRDIEGAKRMKFFTLKMDDGSDPTSADRTVHNFKEVSDAIVDSGLF